MSKMNKSKLETLAKSVDFETVEDLLEKYAYDAVVPAICSKPDCNFITTMEPDQSKGYCEECHDNTVVSCLVLAGVI